MIKITYPCLFEIPGALWSENLVIPRFRKQIESFGGFRAWKLPRFPNRESTLDLVCTALFYLSDSLALQLVNQVVIRQRPVSWWKYLQTSWITIHKSLARLYQTSADQPQWVISWLSMSFCSLPSKNLSTSLNLNCDCQAAKALGINS